MNEWILVGVILGGTILLLGGFGWITSALKGRGKKTGE